MGPPLTAHCSLTAKLTQVPISLGVYKGGAQPAETNSSCCIQFSSHAHTEHLNVKYCVECCEGERNGKEMASSPRSSNQVVGRLWGTGTEITPVQGRQQPVTHGGEKRKCTGVWEMKSHRDRDLRGREGLPSCWARGTRGSSGSSDSLLVADNTWPVPPRLLKGGLRCLHLIRAQQVMSNLQAKLEDKPTQLESGWKPLRAGLSETGQSTGERRSTVQAQILILPRDFHFPCANRAFSSLRMWSKWACPGTTS